jgi:putative endonuclease
LVFSGRLTHSALRFLDGACAILLPRQEIAPHRQLGQRGELDAYFLLRKRGYVMVARNFRSPRRKGEIDLIGWDGDTLCFVEVKTRTSQGAEPAESAVDKKKRKDVVAVAREFLRNLPPACAWRFDLVTVYYDGAKGAPRFELFTDVPPL